MPKIRRQQLPPALLRHLLDRIQQRQISANQLGLLADWLDTRPEVPAGRWFKRFSGMCVCGEGELVKNLPCSRTGSRRYGNQMKPLGRSSA